MALPRVIKRGLPKLPELPVASVKISGKNSLPDRAAVPAGTDSPVGFPAETRDELRKLPGRVPAVWLTLVLITSPGATTVPTARMSSSQAAGKARLAAVQFSCDFSTRRQWMVAFPREFLAYPMMCRKGPGAIRRNRR
jgi:hypothetical protein